MIYIASETAYVPFAVNSSTGAATNADSLPTAVLVRNGAVDGAVSVTVTNLSTGAYLASFAVPSGYAAGDELVVLASATVATVVAKNFVGHGKVDVLGSSLATAIAAVLALADTAATQSTTAATQATAANGKLTTSFTNMVTRFLAMLETYSGGTLYRFVAGALSQAPTGGGGDISVTAFAVLGLRVRLSGPNEDYIPVIAGDDKSVGIFFEDASGNPAPLPSGATAEMLDAAGEAVGTATVSDSKITIGYLLIRLQVPSSGNPPAKLRITFAGGSGAAYKWDVQIRAWS